MSLKFNQDNAKKFNPTINIQTYRNTNLSRSSIISKFALGVVVVVFGGDSPLLGGTFEFGQNVHNHVTCRPRGFLLVCTYF